MWDKGDKDPIYTWHIIWIMTFNPWHLYQYGFKMCSCYLNCAHFVTRSQWLADLTIQMVHPRSRKAIPRTNIIHFKIKFMQEKTCELRLQGLLKLSQRGRGSWPFSLLGYFSFPMNVVMLHRLRSITMRAWPPPKVDLLSWSHSYPNEFIPCIKMHMHEMHSLSK